MSGKAVGLIDELGAGYGVKHTNNEVHVVPQDLHTPIIVVPANKQEVATTLTAPTAIDDRVIAVTSATGISTGKFLTITNVAENRFYVGEVVSVASLNVTLDTPLDFAFPTSGTKVAAGIINMAVNGSVTPQIFSLRATDPGIPSTIDVTRIIFQITCTTAVDLGKFGDIATGLTKGVVIRRVDGTYTNFFNVKKNIDLAGIMFDYSSYTATNPAQGVDGLVSRLTFAGQNKLGVAVRLATNEDLEVIIQDDLTSLTTFKVLIEGHVVA